MNIKVNYPNKNFFTSTAETWYNYLLSGFQKFYSVSISDYLAKESYSKLNFQITAIDIELNNKKARVWYDWCDFRKIHLEIKKPGDYYFKIMLLEGYQYVDKVYPIGQTVSKPKDYFRLLADLRRQKDTKNYVRDVFFSGRTTNYAIRTKAVELIKDDTEINSLVGVQDYTSGSKRPPAPSKLKMASLNYCQFLNECTKSKICLALPGVGGDWTWRHTEILGLGCCLMTLTPLYLLPGNPKDIFITVARDLRDLTDKIKYFSKHDKEREEIAKRGKEYFEKYLRPEAQAKWIIENIK